MVEAILPGAPELQAFEAAITGLNGLASLYVTQAEAIVLASVSLSSRTLAIWPDICRAVADGRMGGDTIAFRDSLRHTVSARIGQLKQVHDLASAAEALAGRVFPGSDELPRLISKLERFRECILDRWETAEDLEELAAEFYPLTGEQLKAAVKAHPAPQAWYDEESKPF